MSDAPKVIVVCGEGEHTDPWHDLPATSAALAGILDGRVVGTADPALRVALREAELLVVNATSFLDGPAPQSGPVVEAILDAWTAGTHVLAVHSSALAFPDDRRWHDLVGGSWRPGLTFHPPIGTALVESGDEEPRLVEHDFELHDERYSALEVEDGVTVLAWHTEEGVRHPLIWTRPSPGARTLYSALGHSTESYESEDHRRLLQRAADWLRAGPR